MAVSPANDRSSAFACPIPRSRRTLFDQYQCVAAKRTVVRVVTPRPQRPNKVERGVMVRAILYVCAKILMIGHK